MRVAAKAFHFEITKPGVDRVAQRRRWLRRTRADLPHYALRQVFYSASAQPVPYTGLSFGSNTASRKEEHNHADYDAEGLGEPHTTAWARRNYSERPSGY
jgi:hypothetical protein